MEWEFEPGHTAVEFRCRHMMVSWVRGHFKNVSGKLSFDPGDPRSAFTEVDIDARSLWTGEPARTHISSAQTSSTQSSIRPFASALASWNFLLPLSGVSTVT
jgi:polyisoprenoid-binding protein YceI